MPTAPTSCPACGQQVAPGARFCSHCGAHQGAHPEERRVATVVFADLVGYTALAESMDPEQVKRLVDSCFERLVAEVAAFGGTVDKIIGDALVALFGAPLAHEDDAERAVRAALRLEEVVATAGDGLVPLQLRVGVNTGEVVVGALRAGGDYTAMGDAVNVAQRLQAAAAPGTVLVGPATYAATASVIRYESSGPITARNREERIDAWRALGATARPGRRPRRRRGPFVGRDAEMAVGDGMVRLAVDRHRAQIVVLHGESGVGKGRLLEELAARAAGAHGALVLEGRCVPYGEPNPWFPLAEALRDGLGLDHPSGADLPVRLVRARLAELLGPGVDDAEVNRLADGVGMALGQPGTLDDIDPQRARDEVTRALVTVLAALAADRLVVLALHDTHWAHELVTTALRGVVRRLAAERFVLLVSTRRQDLDGTVLAMPPHSIVQLLVDPLGRAASATLLDALVTRDLDAERRDAVLERSAGNPYFLEELASLVDSGGELVLPENLRGLVLARLDRLGPLERAVIDDASVLGSSGTLRALGHLTDEGFAPVDPAVLNTLVALDLLEAEGDRWHFRSESVRDVAYATMTKSVRARRHVALADSLLAADPDGRSTADQVAHHLAAAAEIEQELGPISGLPTGLGQRAIAALGRAAGRAVQQESADQALRAVERARLLGSPDTPEAVELELAAAWALTHQRRLHDAESVAEAVLTSPGADERTQGRALTVLAEVAQLRGALAQSRALATRAVDALEAAGARAEMAHALRVRGMTELRSFDVVAANESLGRARAESDAVSDRRGVAWADQHLAWLAFLEGDADRADERVDAAAATFAELSDAGGLGWARGVQAWIRFQQGRFEEAEAIATTWADDGASRGDHWAVGMMTALRASLALWRGGAADAVELARRAHQVMVEIDDRFGQALALATLVRGQVAVGQAEAARASLESLAGLAAADAPPLLLETVRLGVAVHTGTPAPEALEWIAHLPDLPVAYEPFVLAGLSCLQTGDVERAADFARRAAGRRPPGHPFLGGLEALLAAVQGRSDDAELRAAAVLDRPDATYLDRLTALVARAGASSCRGDQVRALIAVDAAVELADGTQDLVARLLARLAQRTIRRSDPSPSDGPVGQDDEIAALQASSGVSANGWTELLRAMARSGRLAPST